MRFLALTLAVLMNVSLIANDWSLTIPAIRSGIVRIEILSPKGTDPAVCSGVVIAREFAVSAAHCFEGAGNDITVNGRDARVARSNRLLDLAVVRFNHKNEAIIPLARATPPAGTEVLVAGYAFSVQDLALQFGRISQAYNKETKTVWVNVDLIFGDSGGGLIDTKGRLIGINSSIYSKGPAHIASIVPIETVIDFLAPYARPVK